MLTANTRYTKVSELEDYFNQFRKNIIGIDQTFESPYGIQKIR
jgi:hypothetical protein